MLSAKGTGPCQSPEMLQSSAYYPRILTRLRLVWWYIKRQGLFNTFRRVANLLAPGLFGTSACSSRFATMEAIAAPDQAHNLQSGEWVEVKSKDEILRTLDEHGKHRGLRFVPEMFEFCGRRLRVLRRVEKICIENTPDVRSVKNTVLLEGGICQGGGIGCDRSCYHFWREIWLRRVPLHELSNHGHDGGQLATH
jgi:hypothetical protein